MSLHAGQNDSKCGHSERRKTTLSAQYSMWGRSSCQDYMCSDWAEFKQTSADFRLSIISFLHSPGTILHVIVACLFSPTSSSCHVSSVSEKINRPTNQVTCSRYTNRQRRQERKLLTAEFEMWRFSWQYFILHRSCFGQQKKFVGHFTRNHNKRLLIN